MTERGRGVLALAGATYLAAWSLGAPLKRGQRYSVWSYAPDVETSVLAAAAPATNPRLGRYLDVAGTRFPFWGSANRFAQVDRLFAQGPGFLSRDYAGLYAETLRVIGLARSPYAATIALESWFRDEGDFSYVEQPLRGNRGFPPLVAFVLDTKEGYCQHYAGAMALMLRLLGVPARVAVGFTSGDYEDGTWVVTDHDAHAWVEVYFPRYGWLAFDPTPGRGELDAQYTVSSDNFARDFNTLGPLLGSGGALDSLAAREAAKASRKPGLEGTGASTPAVREHSDSVLKGLGLLMLTTLAGIWLAKSLRRLLRFASRDPARLADAVHRDLEGYLADQQVRLPESATLDTLARRLEQLFAVDAKGLVDALSRARYGPKEGRRQALSAARRELRQVRRGLRQSLPARARARGLISLRSLAA